MQVANSAAQCFQLPSHGQTELPRQLQSSIFSYSIKLLWPLVLQSRSCGKIWTMLAQEPIMVEKKLGGLKVKFFLCVCLCVFVRACVGGSSSQSSAQH